MKFRSGGEKMRNAGGHQGENERQRKKTERTRTTFRVIRKFLEVSRCSYAK